MFKRPRVARIKRRRDAKPIFSIPQPKRSTKSSVYNFSAFWQRSLGKWPILESIILRRATDDWRDDTDPGSIWRSAGSPAFRAGEERILIASRRPNCVVSAQQSEAQNASRSAACREATYSFRLPAARTRSCGIPRPRPRRSRRDTISWRAQGAVDFHGEHSERITEPPRVRARRLFGHIEPERRHCQAAGVGSHSYRSFRRSMLR